MTGESRKGWLISLAFWLALFVAVALYFAVAVSPKFRSYLELRSEYHTNQIELVRLERQTKYLGQVVEALENDPEFSAELARIDFDAGRPGEDRIAVDPALSLDARDDRPDELKDNAEPPWYAPAVEVLAEDVTTRRWCLAISAALVVFSFTFLQESTESHWDKSTPNGRRGRRWFSRYFTDIRSESSSE